jgi:hypothetical protein
MLSPCRSYCVFLLSCLATPFASRASAVQNPPVQANTQPATRTSTLSGDVSDPSGAKVPEATVHLAKSTLTTDVKTDANGHFSAKLPAGVYDVTIVAAGFSPFITTIKLGSAAATINARLAIATEAEEVNVAADAGSTAAGDNKSALTFKGSDLNTFSSDDSTFQQQIQATASRTAGFLRRTRSAKSASTRIPTPRSTTRWATVASRSSPSPARTLCTATSTSKAITTA